VIFAVFALGGLGRAAAPEVQVMEGHPGLSGQLGRNAPLYLRLSYKSETPIRVQAKGFFQGAEIKNEARWNPSPAYQPGNGEAMAWIAYGVAKRLDEIRVEVSDGEWRPLLIVKLSVNVTWSSAPADHASEPAWVERLNAQQQNWSPAVGEDGSGLYEALIGPLLAAGIPGYFVLQALFAWRFSSGWRIAALLPLLIMLPAMAHAIFALTMGSNLWPILVILAAPVLFLYLCGLWAVRFVVRGSFA
jgi:hypothetical protein